jgi:hypothetical protein
MASEVTCDKCGEKLIVGVAWSHPRQLVDWLSEQGWAATLDNDTIEATYCGACMFDEQHDTSIPEIVRLAVCHIKPGDTLYVESNLSERKARRMEIAIEAKCGVKAWVLPCGVTLKSIGRR